jgi:hypothetical protein
MAASCSDSHSGCTIGRRRSSDKTTSTVFAAHLRYHLPTRPTKESDSRAAKFGSDESCELDAFTPDQLRELVHMDAHTLAKLEEREERNRKKLRGLIAQKN